MNKVKNVGLSILSNQFFQVAVLVVGIILVVYFSGKSAGKKENEKYLAKPLPNNGNGIPANWDAAADALVDELHDVVAGYVPILNSNTEGKIKVMSKFLALTNDQLAVCYNRYNARYGLDDKETMTEAINGEFMWPSNDVQKQLVARLRTLNLR